MRIRRSRPTGDFLQVPNATVRDDRLSHMARGILVELLSRPDGWEATADDMWRASVAKHGKASPGRRAFRAAFSELKEYGYLATGKDALPGGRYGTVLTLTDVPHAGTSERPAQTHETAGGSDVPHAGTSKEEDGGTKTGKKTLSSVTGTPRVDQHLTAFGAFWSNYPKKRDREEAKKAWIAAIERGVEPKRMVDAAQAYARDRAGQDPKYTKYPATWLNKGCYDDEPDPQPGPQLRAVPGGYQPYRNPTDQSVYDEDF